jgi:hypothetical protein
MIASYMNSSQIVDCNCELDAMLMEKRMMPVPAEERAEKSRQRLRTKLKRHILNAAMTIQSPHKKTFPELPSDLCLDLRCNR